MILSCQWAAQPFHGRTSTYNQDPANPGAGHGEMTPSYLLRRNQGRNKSSLMWMRSWVMIPHYPMACPSSYWRAWPKSEMMLLAPLLPCPRIPHSHPSARATSAHPAYIGGPGLKFQPNNLLVNPGPGPYQGQKRSWIQSTIPIDASMWRWRRTNTLTGGRNSKPVGECPWAATL